MENCSSRVVVPKAALYQTQTFYAKGKGKQIQQLVSNLRGDPLAQGKSQSWEGKSLKIPPVSPSIIDCPIIRVEYALVVSHSHSWKGLPNGSSGDMPSRRVFLDMCACNWVIMGGIMKCMCANG